MQAIYNSLKTEIYKFAKQMLIKEAFAILQFYKLLLLKM
jgi:hypothetical protein